MEYAEDSRHSNIMLKDYDIGKDIQLRRTQLAVNTPVRFWASGDRSDPISDCDPKTVTQADRDLVVIRRGTPKIISHPWDETRLCQPSTRRHSSSSSMATDGSAFISSNRRDASLKYSGGRTIGSFEAAISSHNCVTMRSFSAVGKLRRLEISMLMATTYVTPVEAPVTISGTI
jgi:hypothetical protein